LQATTTQLQIQCRGAEQDQDGQDQAAAGDASGGGQGLHRAPCGQALGAQDLGLGRPEGQEGRRDGQDRRQGEERQPAAQLGHVLGEHHQVGRVGDRQHEARRVGDEGAGEQIGQRILHLRRAGGVVDRRGQHHGASVVGKEHRDQDADAIDQGEQPQRRTLGRAHRMASDPVEQPFLPGDLGQQHHADEEQIDVGALGDPVPDAVQR
jgi:hypothetical protein